MYYTVALGKDWWWAQNWAQSKPKLPFVSPIAEMRMGCKQSRTRFPPIQSVNDCVLKSPIPSPTETPDIISSSDATWAQVANPNVVDKKHEQAVTGKGMESQISSPGQMDPGFTEKKISREKYISVCCFFKIRQLRFAPRRDAGERRCNQFARQARAVAMGPAVPFGGIFQALFFGAAFGTNVVGVTPTSNVT
jgi:hypothetical protein